MLLPGPRWGSLQRSLRSLAGFEGAAWEGKGGKVKGEGKEIGTESPIGYKAGPVM